MRGTAIVLVVAPPGPSTVSANTWSASLHEKEASAYPSALSATSAVGCNEASVVPTPIHARSPPTELQENLRGTVLARSSGQRASAGSTVKREIVGASSVGDAGAGATTGEREALGAGAGADTGADADAEADPDAEGDAIGFASPGDPAPAATNAHTPTATPPTTRAAPSP